MQLGGDAVEDFSLLSPSGKPVMIEPIWKEGRGVAISSPLDILLLVGAPGACKSQQSQFSGLRVGWAVEHKCKMT